MKPLEELRQEIDMVDERLVGLLAERSRLVGEVALIKAEEGLPVLQRRRYETVQQHVQSHAASLGIDPQLVESLWEIIHSHSVQSQMKERTGQAASRA